jgi:hypothetical protein
MFLNIPAATAFVLLASLCGGASGLSFHLGKEQHRCISETIPSRSMLTGDWTITAREEGAAKEVSADVPQQPLAAPSDAASGCCTVTVRSPSGDPLFTSSQPTGHFAVTAGAAGLHGVCVANTQKTAEEGSVVSVTLNIKTALEVADHDTVAKKEHVDAIESELDRMKRMAVHVYEEMLYMRERSERQHATNESTRGRLMWAEGAMMSAVIGMGLWQIKYLRGFFRQKKII